MTVACHLRMVSTVRLGETCARSNANCLDGWGC